MNDSGEEPQPPETPAEVESPPVRRRGRRNVIGSSPHREEYVRLMEAGWSSYSLSRYAEYRFGEQISPDSFQRYARRLVKAREQERQSVYALVAERPDLIDVLRERAELIALQKARIAVDVKHEQSMGKLFGSTKAEIRELAALLSEHKRDLQDLGLLPQAGEVLTVHTDRPAPTAEEAPKAATLADLLGTTDEAEVLSMARFLHERTGDSRTA